MRSLWPKITVFVALGAAVWVVGGQEVAEIEEPPAPPPAGPTADDLRREFAEAAQVPRRLEELDVDKLLPPSDPGWEDEPPAPPLGDERPADADSAAPDKTGPDAAASQTPGAEKTDPRAAPAGPGDKPAAGDKGDPDEGDSLSNQPPPWSRSKTPSTLALDTFDHPRELFEQFSIDDFQWRRPQDGLPLVEADIETLGRALSALPRIGLDNIARWRQADPAWRACLAGGDARRGEFFALRGVATSVERQTLPAPLAERLEVNGYYRVTLRLEGSAENSAAENSAASSAATTSDFQEAVVFTPRVPDAWKEGLKAPERAAVDAVFFKVGPPPENQTADGRAAAAPLLFAATHVAWLPSSPRPDAHIGSSQVLLADLGFDFGLFDAIRPRNKQRVEAEDQEAFYQLLAAVGRASAAEVEGRAAVELPLTDLLLKPDTKHGELYWVEGMVLRVTEIPVNKSYIRERLGVDRYYELNMHVPLGDAVIRMGKAGQEGAAGPEFRGSYPVTVCALRLPPGLKPQEETNVAARVPAFFFKIWAYESEYVNRHDKDQLQLSPLLMAATFELQAPAGSARPYLATIVAAGFFVVLVTLWAGYWISTRQDMAAKNAVVRKQFGLAEGVSIEEPAAAESTAKKGGGANGLTTGFGPRFPAGDKPTS